MLLFDLCGKIFTLILLICGICSWKLWLCFDVKYVGFVPFFGFRLVLNLIWVGMVLKRIYFIAIFRLNFFFTRKVCLYSRKTAIVISINFHALLTVSLILAEVISSRFWLKMFSQDFVRTVLLLPCFRANWNFSRARAKPKHVRRTYWPVSLWRG